MVILLLSVSFIIHLILIFWIILLNLRITRLKESEQKLVNLQREAEDLFSSYILEIKEENEKFLNSLKKEKNVQTVHNQVNSSTVLEKATTLNQTSEEAPEQPLRSKPAVIKPFSNQLGAYRQSSNKKQSLNSSNEEVYTPPEQKEEKPVYEQSIGAQVLLLKKEGYSIEEIAKKLDKGKTEIELLLKFSKES